MTPLPLADFTPAQAERRDRIEAAPEPPEGWEQRIRAVARAMSDEDGLYRFTMAYWRRLAAAALTADAPLAGHHATDEEGRCPMCGGGLAPDGGCLRCSYGPPPISGEDICVHGHGSDDAHVCGGTR